MVAGLGVSARPHNSCNTPGGAPWLQAECRRPAPGPQPSSLLSVLDPVEPLNCAGQVGHVGYGGEFAGRVHGE